MQNCENDCEPLKRSAEETIPSSSSERPSSMVHSMDFGSLDVDSQSEVAFLSEGINRTDLNHLPRSEEESTKVFPSNETILRLESLVNFYLSDFNLSKDLFLLKHVTKHKDCYVSLKLLSNYKKIKRLTTNWLDVKLALQNSTTLEINSDGTKVRRLQALAPELSSSTRPFKSFLAYDIPNASATLEKLAQIFGKFGEINSLKIHKPGGKNIPEIQSVTRIKPELGESICAIIEFEKVNGAREALRAVVDGNEFPIKGMDIPRKPETKKYEANFYLDDESSYFSSSEIDETSSPYLKRKDFALSRSSSSSLLSSPCESPKYESPHFPERKLQPFRPSDRFACMTLLNDAPYQRNQSERNDHPFAHSSVVTVEPRTQQKVKSHSGLSSLIRCSFKNSFSRRVGFDNPQWGVEAAGAPSSTPCSPWMKRHAAKLVVKEYLVSDSCPNSPTGSPFVKRRSEANVQKNQTAPVRIIRNPKGPDSNGGFQSRRCC